MIGKLQGKIDFIGEDFVILMAGGVGYKVYTTANPAIGGDADLWIETVLAVSTMGESTLRLYGFDSIAGLDLFNKLRCVSGISAKIAIGILGTLGADAAIGAIASGDIKTLSAAPGLGKKTAEKLVAGLQKKVSGFMVQSSVQNSEISDLLSALESLGYRRTDVAELAQRLARENPNGSVGELVRMALKEISKK
ncbi:MAG: Holliday junction branch migration protein RuvA [Rickettsiales bacterium]|jgi:Holliday junction DNA helicase RuvA|nr:Holliday junction branch migration protein RuvA [Rickettsiales bacterium]